MESDSWTVFTSSLPEHPIPSATIDIRAVDDYGQAVALPGQIKATSTSATGRWLTLDGSAVTVSNTYRPVLPTGSASVQLQYVDTAEGEAILTVSGIPGQTGEGWQLASHSMMVIISVKGDMDGLNGVTVADAILALQAMAGLNPSGIRSDYAVSGADVSHDGKIGMEEALYILQDVAKMR
jgi:hypothetical protein